MICYPMATKATPPKTRLQLNLTPRSEDILKRLDRLAETLKGDKKFRNEVALEIIEAVEPYWERIKRTQDKVVEIGVEAMARGAEAVAVDEFIPEQSDSAAARSPKK